MSRREDIHIHRDDFIKALLELKGQAKKEGQDLWPENLIQELSPKRQLITIGPENRCMDGSGDYQCPNCANRIKETAPECPNCKAWIILKGVG